MSPADDEAGSPPCDLAAAGELPEVSDADAVAGWRRSERRRLRALCRAIDDRQRADLDTRIAAGLDRVLAAGISGPVAVYWPLPGEPDLRDWYGRLGAGGTRLALPVVVEREAPLEFRAFGPGAQLGRDALGIPAPLAAPRVDPALLVLPCLGFDAAGYRLGNGGGYYDRTLPGLAGRPLVVGVAYARCALRSIYPQPHDVPLDHVVTEEAVSPAP